jgi:hypothetical protein
MSSATRFILGLLSMSVLAATNAPATAAQQYCAPSHPPDPCNTLATLHDPNVIHAWPQCPPLKVDIVETSMRNKTCAACPGGVCVTCVLEAYRANGMAAWNAPFASLFGGAQMFTEVKGKPYDVRVRMLTQSEWDKNPELLGHQDSLGTTITGNRIEHQLVGCGTMLKVQRSLTFLLYTAPYNPWNLSWTVYPNARQAAVHELGHVLALKDVSNIGLETIMDKYDPLTWTANPADGQALACLYYPIRSRQCQ